MTPHPLWIEFSQVALAHLIAVASPGPDFAVVLRQNLEYGRRTGIWTSVGIGTAIFLHVTYSILGIGLLSRASGGWFDLIRYAGAAYLGWLGIQALRAPGFRGKASATNSDRAVPPARRAFATGFFTNALNPKVTLFFAVLFVTVVSPLTPRVIQAAYGLWMMLATMAWFCGISMLVTREPILRVFLRHSHWINRALGVVLLVFAIGLVVSKFAS